MNYLEEICKLCKASVTVTVNKHRDYYQTVEDALDEDADWYDDIEDNVRQRMVENDTIVTIQAYPLTPIGFYTVHHYDLNEALKQMYETLKND